MDETVKIVMPGTKPAPKEFCQTYRDSAKRLSLSLATAFVWSETEEGAEFWRSVRNRLRQISDRGY